MFVPGAEHLRHGYAQADEVLAMFQEPKDKETHEPLLARAREGAIATYDDDAADPCGSELLDCLVSSFRQHESSAPACSDDTSAPSDDPRNAS